MTYTLHEYKHNFSSWAACRAAQRGFATNLEICQAIDASTLPAFAKKSDESLRISASTFDSKHDRWCKDIAVVLERTRGESSTYGRAAKIVAIYLKTYVVLDQSRSRTLAFYAHPPIDKVLLKNAAREPCLSAEEKSFLRGVAWTKMDGKEYADVLNILGMLLYEDEPWWVLEKYWNPVRANEILCKFYT